MTRKTDKRRLAPFTTPLFPLGEAFCLLLISPLPPAPQTRPLDFEMLYGVKSSVSFSRVHCDYGHAYLTCTI